MLPRMKLSIMTQIHLFKEVAMDYEELLALHYDWRCPDSDQEVIEYGDLSLNLRR
jgi:hypothetical protein